LWLFLSNIVLGSDGILIRDQAGLDRCVTDPALQIALNSLGLQLPDPGGEGGIHYICQEEPVSTAGGPGTPQFLSMFSTEHNMAVLSAAITRRQPGDNIERPTTWRSGYVKDWPNREKHTEDDYKVFVEFDKGHLFPVLYANDYEQAQASYHLQNVFLKTKSSINISGKAMKPH